MKLLRAKRSPCVLVELALVGLVGAAAADDLQAWVTGTGGIVVGRGVDLQHWPPRLGASAALRVELNAHAPNWLHVPQDEFILTVSEQPSDSRVVIRGELPIPCDPPGALLASEQVEAAGASLGVTYALQTRDPLRLCGLQVSVWLPCESYGGAMVELTGLKTVIPGRTPPDDLPYGTPVTDTEPVFADAAPVNVALPVAASATWNLYTGYCDKLAVTGGAGLPFTLTLASPMKVIIQDNRPWDATVYEIRLAFIMEPSGRLVPADTTFHTALILTVPEPVALSSTPP